MHAGRRLIGCAAALAVALVLTAGSPAFANLPLGACCFANGTCQDLQAPQCAGAGQTFIGEGTSCDVVDCAAPLAAPALSIFGAVAALGALTALGLWRLAVGRRRS